MTKEKTDLESIWDALERHVSACPEFFKAGLRAQDMLHAAAIGRARDTQVSTLTARVKKLEAALKEAEEIFGENARAHRRAPEIEYFRGAQEMCRKALGGKDA